MDKDLEITIYSDKFENEVVYLWKICNLVVPWNDPHEDIQMKIKFQPNLFFIAHIGSEIVGSVMAGYEGHRGWINYLAVHPKHQRRGLGAKIMRFAENKLKEVGCIKINLQVRETNVDVIQFYESIGYKNDNVISLGKKI